MYESCITFQHGTFRHHYLCHYLSMATAADPLSRSLMKFKRGARPDVDAWIDCALTALAALAKDRPDPDTILVRALGHGETHVSGHRPVPLDLLGDSLASQSGCRYLPGLLSKSRGTLANKGLSPRERVAQLLDVYSAAPMHSPPGPATSFLVIDDILTTGATVRAITLALSRSAPGLPIRLFTLARASQDPLPGPPEPLQGRVFRLDPLSGWQLSDPADHSKDPAGPGAAFPDDNPGRFGRPPY
ncbi:MAG TPA: hypothetical protein VHE54_02010 [Puia sp.]|nr:hypothetical protein [Puia sp.]